jgi:hypothetical protein
MPHGKGSRDKNKKKKAKELRKQNKRDGKAARAMLMEKPPLTIPVVTEVMLRD